MNVDENSTSAGSGNTSNRYTYEMAIQDLQKSGCLSVENVCDLSYSDLNCLCEEIKYWCVYGNLDPQNLRTTLSTLNS